MTNANDPAYPIPDVDFEWKYPDSSNGLSKREYFAAVAMQAFINSDYGENYASVFGCKSFTEVFVKKAIETADALIVELNK
jgi:hypothetical protein